MAITGKKPSEWSTATITAVKKVLSLNSANYVTVDVGVDAKANGAALIAAYTAAKALTPNGAALATNNRACVIVPPARYDLDHTDAPAPSGITITPDAVGANPVTWYYRMTYGLADGSLRSLISDEDYFTIGDDTTEIIVDGGVIPDWAEVLTIMLGTTSGYYDYITNPGITSFPSDIFGAYMDLGMGNLYPLGLLAPVHQDCTPLTLDTEFVDIIGLTTDRSLQHIYGTPEATNSGVIVQTANDVHIFNLYVKILTEVESVNWDNTDSAAYFPSTNLSNTVVENCQFDGEDGNNSKGPRLFSMRLGELEYSGTFTNCTGGDYAFGTNGGIASGIFTNCIGGGNSFGSFGIASGIFNNCIGENDAFGGGEGGTASGTFMNCTGGDGSFGANGTASGTFSFCILGVSAFTIPTASVATIELVAGGTGYTADDELTVVGGTGTAATIKVLTVNAGVIETAEILTVGSYTVEPANAVAVTGGTGNNDATFNLTWNEGHIYGCVDNTGFIAKLNWDD